MNLLPDYFLFFSSIEAGYSYYNKLDFEIFIVEQSLDGKKCWIRLYIYMKEVWTHSYISI